VDVCVHVLSLGLACFISDHITNQIISGCAIAAQVAVIPCSIARVDSRYPEMDGPPEESIRVLGNSAELSGGCAAALVVKGFYSREDLEDCNYVEPHDCQAGDSDRLHSDEVAALRLDLIEASMDPDYTYDGFLNQAIIFSRPLSSLQQILEEIEDSFYVTFVDCDSGPMNPPDGRIDACPTVVISATFRELQSAYNFMSVIEGSRVSGALVRVSVDSRDLNSEALEVVARSLQSAATSSLSKLAVAFTPASEVEIPLIAVSKKKKKKKKTVSSENGAGISQQESSAKYTADVVPIKYCEALHAAKQGKHSAPLQAALPISNQDIDEILFTMLGNLNVFQRRKYSTK
jgi:hypothetical protein